MFTFDAGNLKDFATLGRSMNKGRFIKDVHLLTAEFLQRAGQLLKEQLEENLNNIDNLGFEPLTDEWLRRKEKDMLDQRMWHATGELADHIKIIRTKNTVEIGWDEEIHPDSNASYATIAATLEYGYEDRNIPPRPVVKLSRDEAQPRLKPLMAELLPIHLALVGKAKK